MGFIGYIIDMRSLQLMYEKYVEREKFLYFIPTYFLSQEAVEIFFGKIRSCNGCDDNPEFVRFKAAYRKLLAIDSVFPSNKRNCDAFQINSNPFSDILYVSSKRALSLPEEQEKNENIVLDEIAEVYQTMTDLYGAAESELTDNLRSFSIAQMANLIEDKIKDSDNCKHCVSVFDTCVKVEESFFTGKFSKKPCQSTYIICKETDKFMKIELLKGNIKYYTIYYTILNNIDIEQMFIQSDFKLHPSHRLYLIRAIVDGYIQMKGLQLAKEATQTLHPTNPRYAYKKNVHFMGK